MAKGLSGLGFDHDLRLGNEYESDLAIVMKATGDKVEVKADFLAAKTGNVFVEFSQPSGPSGLATTKADWWAFYIVGTHTWLLIQTFQLKKLCRKLLKLNGPVKGGDYDGFAGVLVPMGMLTTNSWEE